MTIGHCKSRSARQVGGRVLHLVDALPHQGWKAERVEPGLCL
jgi:hypothetical protein